MQQVDDFLEGGVGGEVGDLVPDVPQTTGVAVDVGHGAVGSDDLAEALLAHGHILGVGGALGREPGARITNTGF
jgi:hypothetical protein